MAHEEVVKQNDVLLAALRQIAGESMDAQQCFEVARAALAAAQDCEAEYRALHVFPTDGRVEIANLGNRDAFLPVPSSVLYFEAGSVLCVKSPSQSQKSNIK